MADRVNHSAFPVGEPYGLRYFSPAALELCFSLLVVTDHLDRAIVSGFRSAAVTLMDLVATRMVWSGLPSSVKLFTNVVSLSPTYTRSLPMACRACGEKACTPPPRPPGFVIWRRPP